MRTFPVALPLVPSTVLYGARHGCVRHRRGPHCPIHVRPCPEDQPSSLRVDDTRRYDRCDHNTLTRSQPGSHQKSYFSRHLLSTLHGVHHCCDVVRLRVWYDWILRCCCRDPFWLRNGVCRPASPVQQIFAQMGIAQSEVAGIGSCNSEYPKLVPQLAMSILTLVHLFPKKARGILLIMLIRASPFPPWAYSNSLFAVGHTP